MPIPELSEIQRANVLYHSRLAPNYHLQPFLRDDNRLRVRRILEDLQQRTGGRRLLDMGCGAGFISDTAHDLFEKLDGVDITCDMLAHVEPRPNLTTHIASAEALPFADATFDVVTCNGVLHHIESIGAVLMEARRVLRPGGLFYADEIPSSDSRRAISAVDNDGDICELLKT